MFPSSHLEHKEKEENTFLSVMKYGLIAFLTVTTLELTKGKRNSLAITRSGKKDHDTRYQYLIQFILN